MEGDVTVAVVGVLGEHREDQFLERVPVPGRFQRPSRQNGTRSGTGTSPPGRVRSPPTSIS
jgi:hypothetical protein